MDCQVLQNHLIRVKNIVTRVTSDVMISPFRNPSKGSELNTDRYETSPVMLSKGIISMDDPT